MGTLGVTSSGGGGIDVGRPVGVPSPLLLHAAVGEWDSGGVTWGGGKKAKATMGGQAGGRLSR